MKKPIIKRFKSEKSLKKWLETVNPIRTVDIYRDLVQELFLCTNPDIFFSSHRKRTKAFKQYFSRRHRNQPALTSGKWIYFPWNNHVYHIVNQPEYYALRTTRNKILISDANQAKLHNKTVSIAGLSVGKIILSSLVRYGIGSKFKLADNDHFELSNANRTLYDLTNYQQSKLTVASQHAYQIDPYIQIKPYQDGVTENNIDSFVKGSDLIIDAFDNFKIKLLLRKRAKKYKLPVVSGVDMEKGILIIVERYDTEPELDHSLLLNNLDPSTIQKPNVSKEEITNFFIDMIGEELHSATMLKSVRSVGNKLTSYPQLIIASQLLASTTTLMAEKILLKKKFKSFRSHIDLPKILQSQQ